MSFLVGPNRLGYTLVATFLALNLVSCLYDADHRCGANEHVASLGSCECNDGFALQGNQCLPCQANEVWQAGTCVCAAGYARDGDAGACVLSSAGMECDATAPSSCADPKFNVCRPANGSAYCTTDCASDTDCPHGFTCDSTTSPSTCETFALGQGDSCTSDADCVGKDATYCENIQSHVCLVEGCSTTSPLSCSEGWTCCDLHSVGLAKTLCVPEGKCITQ